jgi:hypothetical protein
MSNSAALTAAAFAALLAVAVFVGIGAAIARMAAH